MSQVYYTVFCDFDWRPGMRESLNFETVQTNRSQFVNRLNKRLSKLSHCNDRQRRVVV